MKPTQDQNTRGQATCWDPTNTPHSVQHKCTINGSPTKVCVSGFQNDALNGEYKLESWRADDAKTATPCRHSQGVPGCENDRGVYRRGNTLIYSANSKDKFGVQQTVHQWVIGPKVGDGYARCYTPEFHAHDCGQWRVYDPNVMCDKCGKCATCQWPEDVNIRVEEGACPRIQKFQMIGSPCGTPVNVAPTPVLPQPVAVPPCNSGCQAETNTCGNP